LKQEQLPGVQFYVTFNNLLIIVCKVCDSPPGRSVTLEHHFTIQIRGQGERIALVSISRFLMPDKLICIAGG